MSVKEVILAGLLDVKEIVFRRNFTEWQNLAPVRLAVWRVHEQVAEITQPFCVAHSFTHLIEVGAALCHFGHVQDKYSVRAVLVMRPILTPCELLTGKTLPP